jgi:AcrR family transcriptional regulator
MSDCVKPRRRYESTRRQEQAAQTRRDIVAAADRLFRERGYTQTSMPAIASAAGVVVETIYRTFGSKASLFRAVVEAALAGGPARAEVPVEERPAIRAVIEEQDPRRKVDLYAATQPGVHRRSAPLTRLLRDAASNDDELSALHVEFERARFIGQGKLADALAAAGHLREDLTVDDARDLVWTLCSPDVYEHLVVDRGWSADKYRDWLASTLAASLLATNDRSGK